MYCSWWIKEVWGPVGDILWLTSVLGVLLGVLFPYFHFHSWVADQKVSDLQKPIPAISKGSS